MAFNVGNTKIGSLYLGSTKIASAYAGNVQIFSSATPVGDRPYIRFQLDGSSHPRLGAGPVAGAVEWVRISSSPNIWDLKINNWYYPTQGSYLPGLPFLFCTTTSPNQGTITSGNVIILGSYGLDQEINGEYCQNFDRMFSKCTGIIEIANPIQCSKLIEVGSMFQECTNIASGQYDQYIWLSTNATNIASHSGTFYNCGSGTPTGAAELAQIPVGWGGTLVPASTLMTSGRVRWKSTYDTWKITANGPDWTAMNGVYVFTGSSVSSFAGVSMNRSRIARFNSLVTTQGQAALYFYPCFMQHTSTAITWAVTTASPNGSLTISQGNTDMPGTLDYSTYGPFAHEYGSYDSAGTVYFCFLVTNDPISSSFDLSSTPYGVLYNGNFKQDARLRWFR